MSNTMTPPHQTPPTLTVYVAVKASERLPTEVSKQYFVRVKHGQHLFNSLASTMWKDSKHKVMLFVGYNTDSSHYIIDNVHEWLEPRIIPDPSYINAIINDPGSNDDKVKRLSEYLNTFTNLTKY